MELVETSIPAANEEARLPAPLSELRRTQRRWPRRAALWVAVIACLLFGYSLDRYPGFYVDDVFFAYPAVQAIQGHAFAYASGGDVPFRNQIWAYHGPVLPNLELLLFRVFGYHFTLTRLPDFLGAWAALVMMVLYLNRRGYRVAGLLLAVGWVGDRAAREVMYGRMEGLGLLSLVLLLYSLDRVWRLNSRPAATTAGFLAGLSILIHPLCASFALLAFVVVAFRQRIAGGVRFCAGALVNIPLVVALWHFHPVRALIQFRAVAADQTKITGLERFGHMYQILGWSRVWICVVLVVAGCVAVNGLRVYLRSRSARDRSQTDSDLFLLGIFSLAGLILLSRSSFYPYYLTYVTMWPLCAVAILTERSPRFRPVAFLLVLCWLPSAAWNLSRLTEPIRFYHSLSHQFIEAKLRSEVPAEAEIVTSSALYSVPVEAGYRNRELLFFQPHHQDVCPTCYLLLPRALYEKDNYVTRSNLDHRSVLYDGPAFPGAGELEYPVVILSPERDGVGAAGSR